jgi:hypothetical protein
MSRVRLPLLLTLALVPWAASAEPAAHPASRSDAASRAVAWDDSHMRSNFARRFDDVPPRPPIQGEVRYHQVLEAPADTPRIDVPEMTLTLNPHGWQPGLGQGARDTDPVAHAARGSRLGSIKSMRSARSRGVRGSSHRQRIR